MGYLIGFGVIFALVFLWTYNSGLEKEHTMKRVKESLQGSVMAVIFVLLGLFMILATLQMCSDVLDTDEKYEYDYIH